MAGHLDPPLAMLLAERLRMAVQWQLQLCQRPSGEYGIFVINDASFRGTGEPGLNTPSSYWDLIRFGYKSAYINLRVIEALQDYARLTRLGAVPAIEGLADATASIEADFVRQFIRHDGSLLTWIGCSAVNGSVCACTPSAPSG